MLPESSSLLSPFVGYDWESRSWEKATELAAARLSVISYQSDEAQSDAGEKAGLAFFGYHKNDVDAGVYYDKERLLIAVRGSEFTWRDWVRNIHAFPSARIEGIKWRGHAGFYGAAEMAWGGIKETLSLLADIETFRWVGLVGHSQGGAIAQVIAELMQADFPQLGSRINVRTIGSPRTFWHDAQPVANHIRTVLYTDPVPMVPPATPAPLRGFSHHGHLHALKPDGDRRDYGKNGSMFFYRVSTIATGFLVPGSRAYAAYRGYRALKALQSHVGGKYLSAIEKSQ